MPIETREYDGFSAVLSDYEASIEERWEWSGFCNSPVSMVVIIRIFWQLLSCFCHVIG